MPNYVVFFTKEPVFLDIDNKHELYMPVLSNLMNMLVYQYLSSSFICLQPSFPYTCLLAKFTFACSRDMCHITQGTVSSFIHNSQ